MQKNRFFYEAVFPLKIITIMKKNYFLMILYVLEMLFIVTFTK